MFFSEHLKVVAIAYTDGRAPTQTPFVFSTAFVITRHSGGIMVTILIVIVVLMLFGAIPRWPHSRNWGYGPSGGVGLVLLILVILMLSGRL